MSKMSDFVIYPSLVFDWWVCVLLSLPHPLFPLSLHVYLMDPSTRFRIKYTFASGADGQWGLGTYDKVWLVIDKRLCYVLNQS